ncbi:IclR family transcriptional regulator [Spiractinospora alimapuensis]|uniref:IclR family transcriptional regulator n=1 Tax=Spiractinospora alimapuensis TaxID=2820884 RepID=UPI001F39B899|nr:IclR family transcriptional regulator [Spiractinospora alimapuensis]QVQ52902.1 IclR family transcriptional regulator [Spiractinospora alimapuensis]
MTIDDSQPVARHRSGTQSVDRAIAILRCFEHEPTLTATQVAQRLDLTVSTAHRLMRALQETGLLGRDATTESYHLGVTVAVLGRIALERLGTTVMQPALERLRDTTGESVTLGVRSGDEIAILVQLPSPEPLRYDQRPGSRNPIHVCSMGKALLAFGDPALAGTEPYTRYTDTTITSRAGLDAELARVRARGYATSDQERVLGVRAIAAPVRDHNGDAFAAVALQVPTVRFADDRLEELAEAVTSTARELSTLATGG